jgi:hypothetical protein
MSGLFDAFSEKSEEKTLENTANLDSNEPVKIETQNVYHEDFKELMIKIYSMQKFGKSFLQSHFALNIGMESCRLLTDFL